jgi:thiol-disulfide isomerase/thioredoxin
MDFGITGYLENSSNSIPIKKDGSFEHKSAVWKQQKMYLHLNNDAYVFTVLENDTLTLEWDHSDLKKTFTIKGSNSLRTANLQMQLNLQEELLVSVRKLYEKLSDQSLKLESKEKFSLINELYNSNVKMVLDASLNSFSNPVNDMITGLYFQFTKILKNERLLGQFELTCIFDTRSYPFFDVSKGLSCYRQLNDQWFWNVPEYRDFIYDYTRLLAPFSIYNISGASPAWLTSAKAVSDNPTLQAYYTGQGILYNSSMIKDWFATKIIIDGFQNYSFEQAERVYELYGKESSTPYLREILAKYYAAVSSLKPGTPSPGFSLKDETGNVVSLSDFKGKVVYIDFWGVTCGPCIYDIKNHVPGLHKKYENKNVVFINICVDSNERQWKQALKQYKINGINLIAEGWGKNPVCMAYNVTGIPHYVLIDKDGKMANNNAPRASELNLESTTNEIDLLLK